MNNKLAVTEQRAVVFYDDELTAAKATDGHIYVGLRQMCDALGIDSTGQRQRINRSTVLNDGLMVCKLQTIQGERDAYVLRVDLVPMWLSGIRSKSVREEVRPKLERFQREAAKVLWEAFSSGRLTYHDQIMNADSPAAKAYQIATALQELARYQWVHEQRLDSAEMQLADHSQRIEQLEVQLGNPDRLITPGQASEVSQAVKAVAMSLSAQTGGNEYGGVYGELYRRYSITSYKQLPANKFTEAINWLNQWRESLDGDEAF